MDALMSWRKHGRRTEQRVENTKSRDGCTHLEESWFVPLASYQLLGTFIPIGLASMLSVHGFMVTTCSMYMSVQNHCMNQKGIPRW